MELRLSSQIWVVASLVTAALDGPINTSVILFVWGAIIFFVGLFSDRTS